MEQSIIFLTILGMSLATFIPRLLPVLILSTRMLPDVLKAWLRYIPAAVLSAMLIPTVLLQNSKVNLSWDNIYLLAFFPTLLVAWKTRSLLAAVVVGVILVAAGRFFFG